MLSWSTEAAFPNTSRTFCRIGEREMEIVEGFQTFRYLFFNPVSIDAILRGFPGFEAFFPEGACFCAGADFAALAAGFAGGADFAALAAGFAAGSVFAIIPFLNGFTL